MAEYMTEKPKQRRVYYTGTAVLKEGYPLTYNRDTNAGVTITSQETDKFARAYEVEQPTVLANFAGLVDAQSHNAQGPCWCTINEPGRVSKGWIGIATTIDSTEIGLAGSTWVLTTPTAAVPVIGKALVTDAGTTAKAREMVLYDPAQARIDMMTSLTGPSSTGTSITGTSTLVTLKADVIKLKTQLNVLYMELKEAGLMKLA